MEIGEMINENNAMLQLCMQNQCYLEIILEQVAGKIKEDFANDPPLLQSMMELRRQMAENYYRATVLEVKKILDNK